MWREAVFMCKFVCKSVYINEPQLYDCGVDMSVYVYVY